MQEERREAAREVIRAFDVGDHWLAVMDPDIPSELARFIAAMVDAYRREDLDWLLEHCDPELEIVQLEELPDPHSYHGRDGFIEALLDWPRQWDDFRIRPLRIFAPDESHFVVNAMHSGRSPTVGIEVEAEIFFLLRVENELLTHWDMFLTREETLRRAERRSGGGPSRARPNRVG